MIGTTRFMNNSAGSQVDPAVYTAFGERISGTNHRYGYVGAYGYQSHDDFPFLHVGHRYYDPATGRFLQRDPIGIGGGLNVYAYVSSRPTLRVDPAGLWDWFEAIKWGVAGGIGGIVIIGTAPAVTAGVIAAACIVTVSSGVAGGLEEEDIPRPRPPRYPRGRCTRGCHGEGPPDSWPAPPSPGVGG